MLDIFGRLADQLLSLAAPKVPAKACMDYERDCATAAWCMRCGGDAKCRVFRQSCCGATCSACYCTATLCSGCP